MHDEPDKPLPPSEFEDEQSTSDVSAGLEELERRARNRQEIQDRESERDARERILRMTIRIFASLLAIYALLIVAPVIDSEMKEATAAQPRMWQLIIYVTPIFASYWGFYYATTTRDR